MSSESPKNPSMSPRTIHGMPADEFTLAEVADGIIWSMSLRYAAALVAALVTAVAAHAQSPRQDGQWEVKIEMSMPGLPEMPPMTQTQCITPEEARNPQKALPQGGPGDQSNCKISDYKTTGNKVTWSLKCEGPPPMSGTGDFTYVGDTYTGTFKMDMGGQTMTVKYAGKRLGDCKK